MTAIYQRRVIKMEKYIEELKKNNELKLLLVELKYELKTLKDKDYLDERIENYERLIKKIDGAIYQE